jgi:hypothetical protein
MTWRVVGPVGLAYAEGLDVKYITACLGEVIGFLS